MLIGQYLGKISSKGRVALPKKFRQVLGDEVVLARWYENCLVVVSKTAWEKILQDFTGGRAVTLPARDTDRFLLGGAFEVELDAQGRFVVPQALRAYADLKDEIIFAGLHDRVEIWDKVLWEKHERKLLQRAPELAERLAQKRGQEKS